MQVAACAPELDTFGPDAQRKLDDKADCLLDYRYHIAIENYVGEHHWTEKLAGSQENRIGNQRRGVRASCS